MTYNNKYSSKNDSIKAELNQNSANQHNEKSEAREIRAEEIYFDEIWSNSRRALLQSSINHTVSSNGKLKNLQYILSTVAVLKDQISHQTDEIISKITEIQRELIAIDSTHYYYPIEILHITLVGCTPFYDDMSNLTPERIEKIREICNGILKPGRGHVKIDIRGVNVAGSSVFLQGFGHDNKWGVLRKEIIDALRIHEENPLEFPEVSHIHMNMMKLTHKEPHKLEELVNKIAKLRNVSIGKLIITNVDLMVTDMLMSVEETRCVEKFYLL